MKIFIATDHAGFELKQKLVVFLKQKGFEVVDKGAYKYDAEDDYPDFISLVAKEVSKSLGKERGIILGGSGQGEAIVANRFSNVRAVVFNGQYSPSGREVPDEIMLSRKHNDSNVLSLGARFLTYDEVIDAVSKWLNTPFSEEEKHKRRIKKIEEVNSKKSWLKLFRR